MHVLTTVARLVAEAGASATSCRGLQSHCAHRYRSSACTCCGSIEPSRSCCTSARETGELDISEHRVGDPPTPLETGDPDARARILCTVRQGTRVHGAVWLTSSVEDAFDAAHQSLMDSVVDVLGLAFEHTAIIDRETLRRERIDSLRGLLHTMAGALDIRHVFNEVSDVVRGGLPHDILVITAWGRTAPRFASTPWPGPRPTRNCSSRRC